MDPESNINYAPDGGGGGVVPGADRPEGFEPPEYEQLPEEVRARMRQYYTVEGTDFIDEIEGAKEKGDLQALKVAYQEAVGFMEGLYFGIYESDYDLETPEGQRELMNMFTSVESSTDRPSYGQVFLSFRDTVTHTYRVAKRKKRKYDNNQQQWRSDTMQQRIAYWNYVSKQQVRDEGQALPDEEVRRKASNDVVSEIASFEDISGQFAQFAGMKDNMESRVLIFDTAFSQRQKISERDDRGADIDNIYGAEGTKKPDKGHFASFYQSDEEWGTAVDRVERAMVDIAYGELDIDGVEFAQDIYTRGFKNTAEFTLYLKALLEKSKINDEGEGRMDVVWAAWRMSMWKETISKLAWTVGVEEKDGADGEKEFIGNYAIGNPPITNDVILKTAHSDKIRAKEYGMNAVIQREGDIWAIDWDNGGKIDKKGVYVKLERVDRGEGEKPYYKKTNETEELDEVAFTTNLGRTKEFKAQSHSGSGVDIGRIGALSSDFMNFATVEVTGPDGKPEGSNLWNEWYEKGKNQAEESFPWMEFEMRHFGAASDEMSKGTGLWYLERARAFMVLREHLRKLPDPREMNANYFKTMEMRLWEKLKKLDQKEIRRGEVPKNPAAHWLAGIVLEKAIELNMEHPYVQAMIRSGRVTRSVEITDKADVIEEQKSENQASILDFIADAQETTVVKTGRGTEATVSGAGVISNSEADWLRGLIVTTEVDYKQAEKEVAKERKKSLIDRF